MFSSTTTEDCWLLDGSRSFISSLPPTCIKCFGSSGRSVFIVHYWIGDKLHCSECPQSTVLCLQGPRGVFLGTSHLCRLITACKPRSVQKISAHFAVGPGLEMNPFHKVFFLIIKQQKTHLWFLFSLYCLCTLGIFRNSWVMYFLDQLKDYNSNTCL